MRRSIYNRVLRRYLQAAIYLHVAMQTRLYRGQRAFHLAVGRTRCGKRHDTDRCGKLVFNSVRQFPHKQPFLGSSLTHNTLLSFICKWLHEACRSASRRILTASNPPLSAKRSRSSSTRRIAIGNTRYFRSPNSEFARCLTGVLGEFRKWALIGRSCPT